MSKKKVKEIVYLKKGADMRNGEPKIVWKIGHTRFPEQRLIPSASCGILGDKYEAFFSGDYFTEKAVHMYFDKYKVVYGKRNRGKEIFEGTDYILSEFSKIGEEKEKIYRSIWENRNDLFEPEDITYNINIFSTKERILGRAIKVIGYRKALSDARSDKENTLLNNRINNFIVTKYKVQKNDVIFKLY